MANNNKHPKPAGAKSATPSSAKSSKAAPEPVEEVSRVQRIVTWVGFSILGFGILSLFALLLGESLTPLAISENTGIWAVVAFIPDIAIPIGFLTLIVMLILSFRRRSQAAKVAGK